MIVAPDRAGILLDVGEQDRDDVPENNVHETL